METINKTKKLIFLNANLIEGLSSEYFNNFNELIDKRTTERTIKYLTISVSTKATIGRNKLLIAVAIIQTKVIRAN